MRRWLGFSCLAVLVTAISLSFWACGDSNSPSSPSAMFEPAALPNLNTTGATATTPGVTPTDEGRQFTILEGSDVLKRQDCRKQDTGWFLPDGFDITVRIDKRLDDDYRMVSNVFWSPDIGCAATTDQPGRGSSWDRDGKFLKASFNAEKECGRYQWDLKAINVTTGEELNIYYGVLNTGNESCSPPPPPPRDPACEDYEAPKISIEGEPQVQMSEVRVKVGQGSVVADSFSVEFPYNTARPAYGEDPGSWSFTAYRSESYGPEKLECSVSTEKEFSGPVEPKACEAEWIEQDPKFEYGEYGKCKSRGSDDEEDDFLQSFGQNDINPPQDTCKGTKSRRVVKTINEVNSCTQEVRKKSVEPYKETTECEYQCTAALCHTEHRQYCGDGPDGRPFCQKKPFESGVVKWQCQNVPPGKPGHYPNHFDANEHDDFFGSCSVEKCYEIKN